MTPDFNRAECEGNPSFADTVYPVTGAPQRDCMKQDEIERIRELEFPVTRHWAYLDHATRSPLPRSVAEASKRYFTERCEHGFAMAQAWFDEVERCRKAAAALIGASYGDMAFIGNTAQGIGHVANGFPFRPGDNVVLSDVEYPAAVYPWLNLESKGVRIRWIRTKKRGLIRLEDVERAVNERTRIVCMSLVSFWSGQRLPFRSIGNWCGERGVYFVADGTQAVGQVRVDVQRDGIDALAVEGRKWLLAPEGIGFWYCSPALLDRLNVDYVGAASVKNSDQYLEYLLELKDGAVRFESGALNVPGILGLGRALELFREWDMERVEARVRFLAGVAGDLPADLGRNRLFAMPPEYESGIVCFEGGGEAEALRRHLKHARIRMGVGRNRCSISPHFYNTEDEIRRALTAIAELRERQARHEQ